MRECREQTECDIARVKQCLAQRRRIDRLLIVLTEREKLGAIARGAGRVIAHARDDRHSDAERRQHLYRHRPAAGLDEARGMHLIIGLGRLCRKIGVVGVRVTNVIRNLVQIQNPLEAGLEV